MPTVMAKLVKLSKRRWQWSQNNYMYILDRSGIIVTKQGKKKIKIDDDDESTYRHRALYMLHEDKERSD